MSEPPGPRARVKPSGLSDSCPFPRLNCVKLQSNHVSFKLLDLSMKLHDTHTEEDSLYVKHTN